MATDSSTAGPSLVDLEHDPRLFLYTSLTAGSSHIITATSRLETILKANKIPFTAIDLATDEQARRLWQRRGAGRKLPGLVKEGFVLGDLNEVEEWNEFEELHENIGPVPEHYTPPATGAQSGVTLAPPSIGPNKVSGPSGASPKEMVRPPPQAAPESERSSIDTMKGVALPGADEIAARHKAAAEAAAAAKAAGSVKAPENVKAEVEEPPVAAVNRASVAAPATTKSVDDAGVVEEDEGEENEDVAADDEDESQDAEDEKGGADVVSNGVRNLDLRNSTLKPSSHTKWDDGKEQAAEDELAPPTEQAADTEKPALSKATEEKPAPPASPKQQQPAVATTPPNKESTGKRVKSKKSKKVLRQQETETDDEEVSTDDSS